MHYLITILFICFLSIALSHPELKRRDDDEYDEKPHRSRPSLFGGSDNHDFFSSGVRQLNDFMKSISDLFRQQIDSASNMMHNLGKGLGFNFNNDDIKTNTTVNSSESHTEQVGDNYVITNITRLDKVDQNGKKYRIINKNVRVKPVNGSEDILNSDRTYVIMEPEKVNEHQSHGSPKSLSKKIPEDKAEIEPSVTIDKFPSVATKISDKSSSVGTESTETPPSVASDAETLGERENVAVILPFDKQWEKVDQNVLFDKKKQVVTADLERNDIFK